MLVLTLKLGDKVILGKRGEDGALVEECEVQLVERGRSQIKLGFIADPNVVRIHRSAVWTRIREERERAKRAQGQLPGIEAA